MTVPRDLDGITVLVRCDLAAGITDACVAHLRALATRGARPVIVAGHGEPRGELNPAMSLRRFAGPLAEALKMPVRFIGDCVGPVAESGLASVPAGSAALLENIRFHPDASRQSRTFALRLSVLADCFSIPDGMPDHASPWIRELAALLPEPTPVANHQLDRIA